MTLPSAPPALLDAVEAQPWAFDFFALLRLVECENAGAPRWGEATRPAQEPIRLGQEPDVDFAPAAIACLERNAFGAPRLGVRFLGLLGPQGPMPLHLTEYARDRIHHAADPTLARFLDIFHHRMLALFYRAWAQCQPTVQGDRPREDRFAAWIGTSFGRIPDRGADGSADDRARLFHAGTLAGRSRHPEALAKILASCLDVPARVEPWVAHRMRIPQPDRSRLGIARNRPQGAPGLAAKLGLVATAGSRVHDRQSRFRVVLGPLTLERYLGFLPGQPDWARLVDWVRQAVGLDLLWDVRLCLAGPDVPAPAFAEGLQLGVTTWLGYANNRSHGHDRCDLLLESQRKPFAAAKALGAHRDPRGARSTGGASHD
jgi:type VI secretion system protein ImpH